MHTLVNTILAMKGVPIMVVGDLMLDTFVYGDVDRISPESPVPVLLIGWEEGMLGGAGNVLSNLCALGAAPFLVTALGDDANADRVTGMASGMGANTGGIIRDASRPTTLKTRYLARHQQLLRTDFEKTHDLSADIEIALLKSIQSNIKTMKAIVLSDYGKGVLTKTLLKEIITLAAKAAIPVLVDPKGRDFTLYRGADIVTPNRKELGEASGTTNLKTDADIESAALKIINDCGISCVLATRSEDGMSIIRKGRNPVHLPTNAQDVFDVSGAGDTVIATMAACLAAGADIVTAATLSNIAGGIAVSKVGTAPVRADELRAALEEGASSHQATLATPEDALDQVKKWRSKGLKIGFTNGCFDILHAGHVRYLSEARTQCDRLIVALNHDASVRLLKGPTRPVNDEQARASVLGALGCVDLVILFGATKPGEDNTPSKLIESLQPDIFFKGGDYTVESLPEAKAIQAYGGKIEIMPTLEGYSTTNIIKKSRT